VTRASRCTQDTLFTTRNGCVAAVAQAVTDEGWHAEY
jgi:hypothetical protein